MTRTLPKYRPRVGSGIAPTEVITPAQIAKAEEKQEAKQEKVEKAEKDAERKRLFAAFQKF